MLEPRFGCSVVAHQGKIYVSGGYGHDKAILSSTECYDPLTGMTINQYNFLIGDSMSMNCSCWPKRHLFYY